MNMAFHRYAYDDVFLMLHLKEKLFRIDHREMDVRQCEFLSECLNINLLFYYIYEFLNRKLCLKKKRFISQYS